IEKARSAYEGAGVPAEQLQFVESVGQLEEAIAAGRPAITDDALLLCQAEGIDVIVEITGAVEFGARVVLEALAHGKHVVTMNAELDGTVGAILQVYARRAGVVLTLSDGDQ